MVPGVLGILKSRSALAELRSETGGLQTVLLAFLHSRVTGQEAGSLEGCAVFRIDAEEGAGDAVTDRARLTGDAAALDGADDVNLADHVGGDQRLTDDQLQSVQTKVVVDLTTVDDDGAGAVLIDADAGNGGLPSAGAVLILSLALVHSLLPPELVLRPGFGLLSGMGMLSALEDLQTVDGSSAEGVLGKHSLNSKLDNLLRLLFHHFLKCCFL